MYGEEIIMADFCTFKVNGYYTYMTDEPIRKGKVVKNGKGVPVRIETYELIENHTHPEKKVQGRK